MTEFLLDLVVIYIFLLFMYWGFILAQNWASRILAAFIVYQLGTVAWGLL